MARIELPPPDDERSYPPDEAAAKALYETWEWKKISYAVKLANGWRCQACGAERSDGVRIVSDHIRPIRYYWHLRLDDNNVQCLCEDCNKGKASWDTTDHRLDTKARLLAAINEFREPFRPQKLKDAITTAYSQGAISQEVAMALIRDFRLTHE